MAGERFNWKYLEQSMADMVINPKKIDPETYAGMLEELCKLLA